MQLTRKIRIYPAGEQEAVLWELSEINRKLYNRALNERREAYAAGIKGVNYIKQQNDLPEQKKEWPVLRNVNAKVLQMTLKTLDANYRSFFELIRVDPDANPPGFKGRNYFTTMKYNQSGFKVANDSIRLSHNMPDRAELVFLIPEQEFGRVKQVEVFQDNKEAWYLAVVEEIVPPRPVDNGQYQAWDLGVIKQTGVNSQGKFVEVRNIRPDRYWNPKIDAVQSRRDHCKKKSSDRKPSRRWRRYNAAKRTMERKRSNQLNDFQHKVSKKLVENTRAGTIIIGDLSVKKMPKSRSATRQMNRSTQGTGYLARFAGFLTYKAILAGKQVLEIGEEYTSKTCCCCGTVHTEMTVRDRVMHCDCGTVLDRDRNAAINMMLRYLLQHALWTGYRQFAGNLRQTGLRVPEIPGHSQEAPCAKPGGSSRSTNLNFT